MLPIWRQMQNIENLKQFEAKGIHLKTYFVLNELSRDIEIGCAEEEYGIKQNISITIRAMLDAISVFCGDTDHPPYDYCDMIKAVDDAIASQSHFILQETLFLAIAERLLSHPLVESIDLSLSKTNRYENCKSLGVEGTLNKSGLQVLLERVQNNK
jgi:dihydroneopterin aldolase